MATHRTKNTLYMVEDWPMPDAHTLLLFAAAALALLIVPGPSVIYIVTRSASQGRRAGIASMLEENVPFPPRFDKQKTLGF